MRRRDDAATQRKGVREVGGEVGEVDKHTVCMGMYVQQASRSPLFPPPEVVFHSR